MDEPTVVSPFERWELLGHLALLGSGVAGTGDMLGFLEQITRVFQDYFPNSWGVLAARDTSREYIRVQWGCPPPTSAGGSCTEPPDKVDRSRSDSACALTRLPLRVGTEEVGYVMMNREVLQELEKDPPFLHALLAQLSVLVIPRQPTKLTNQYPCFNARATNSFSLQRGDFPLLSTVNQSPLEVLHDVSRLASQADCNEKILSIILAALVQVLQADHARLFVRDDEQGKLVAMMTYQWEATSPPLMLPIAGNALLEWLEVHREPLVSLEVAQDPLVASWRETWLHQPVFSLVVIPLFMRGMLIGIMDLAYTHRPLTFPLSPTTSMLCHVLANHAATVLETIVLARQAEIHACALQVKVGELSTLLEAARILGSLLRPDEVLSSLMDLVMRQLQVSTVALWTIRDDQMLVPAAMDGAPLETARNMRVPVGRGLTGTVAATGKPLIVRNVQESGGSFYPQFNRENNLTSFMGVPVFFRETIVGVLSVMSVEERDFTHDEMMLLVGLAGQAAVALENARLFEERERRINELTSINDISSAVNASLDVDETLLALHCGISEVIDTTYSFIGLYMVGAMGDSPILHQRVIRNNGLVQISELTIPIDGKGLVDHVLLSNQPLLLNTTEEIVNFRNINAATMPEGIRQEQEILAAACNLSLRPASWLGVPILMGNEVLGMINVQSVKPYAFSKDDMRFLSTIASQAAIAISNARLFSERESRLREITVLKDIGRAISSTLDLKLVLDRLYHELSQAIDMRTSVIGLYDEQSQTISYPVCYDHGRRVYLEPTQLSDDANGWVIRNRQPLLIHTNEQREMMGIKDFGFSVFDLRSGLSKIRHPQSRRIQSLLTVPIISGDRVLGFISTKSYQPYTFDENDLRFLTTVASQVAIAISNIYLFIERERRIEELETFNEIGQALSATVRFDELPTLIYRQTSRLIDTKNFYMALYDEGQQQITFPLYYEHGTSRSMETASFREERHRDDALRESPEQGLYRLIVYLTRRVIHRREPLLLQDLNLGTSEWYAELIEEVGPVTAQVAPPRSWLGVPMMVSNKVIGVIGVQDYERPHAYSHAEVRLLSTIASWAAIALENARLFEQISDFATSLERSVAERTIELERANARLRQEKDYLETVHAITLELTSILDLDEIIHRSLEVASTNLGVSRGSIMLREIQSGKLYCRAVLRDRGVVESANLPIAFGRSEGLVGWVMQHQEPVCIADVRSDPRWIVEQGRADDVRSVVAAPLIAGDSTLGVIILTSNEVGYFSESQVRMLATIANEVAIAINNAQLYGYITEMATRLADLLEQQREETSKSRAILQSLTEGVIVLDQDGQIELINWAAEHVLNIPAAEVLNHPVHLLATYGHTEEQRQRAALLYHTMMRGLESVRKNQRTYSTSIEFNHPTQMVAMHLAPVVGLDGQNYGNVAVLRDITREIQADQAKREFVSKVSHELRTPLTAIRGYIDLLLLQSMGTLSPTQISFLDVVKTNTNRLMDLINDILDISRIEAGKINLRHTRFDIGKVIRDVYQSLRLEAAAKNIAVTLEIPEGLPEIVADEKRITQVIFNLFSNAIKYTYDGGKVWIRASLNPAQMLQVDVEDTGIGMTPEQMEKLFLPFYRADSPLRELAGGTGLGLSIARSLVEQHNGEMWVRSEYGKGSTFSFILPLTQELSELDEGNG